MTYPSPGTLTISLPRPHAGQLSVYNSKSRFRVLACGRRWGKTIMEMIEGSRTALGGGYVGWFVPSYKFMEEPWREIHKRLRPVIARSNKSEKIIELVTGGRFDFWTLDKDDPGRSFKYHRAIVDEAGMIPNLGSLWNDAILPTLTDYTGDAIFGGTPKGRNFFWEIWRRGNLADEFEEWQSFHAPTSSNPHLPPQAYNREYLLSQGLPERSYQQEFLAEFLDDAGGVFLGVPEVIDRGRNKNEDPLVGEYYFAGIDLAQVNDWTVISICDRNGRQVYFDRFNRLSWSLMIERLLIPLRLYNATAFIDATGVGAPVYEAINGQVPVQPFTFTAASKAEIVEKAVAAVQRKELSLMDIAIQTDELTAFEYTVTKSGTVRMNAPEGMHDDCVMALCLMNHARAVPQFAIYT